MNKFLFESETIDGCVVIIYERNEFKYCAITYYYYNINLDIKQNIDKYIHVYTCVDFYMRTIIYISNAYIRHL